MRPALSYPSGYCHASLERRSTAGAAVPHDPDPIRRNQSEAFTKTECADQGNLPPLSRQGTPPPDRGRLFRCASSDNFMSTICEPHFEYACWPKNILIASPVLLPKRVAAGPPGLERMKPDWACRIGRCRKNVWGVRADDVIWRDRPYGPRKRKRKLHI